VGTANAIAAATDSGIVASGLTPAQLKAYRIADNQTADIADWDYTTRRRSGFLSLTVARHFSSHVLHRFSFRIIIAGHCQSRVIRATSSLPRNARAGQPPTGAGAFFFAFPVSVARKIPSHLMAFMAK
jgi:hypothetical protein